MTTEKRHWTKNPWAWSILLTLVIGAAPVVIALLGELFARMAGCEVAMPMAQNCRFVSESMAFTFTRMMTAIAYAVLTVPAAIAVLVATLIAYSLLKNRGAKQ